MGDIHKASGTYFLYNTTKWNKSIEIIFKKYESAKNIKTAAVCTSFFVALLQNIYQKIYQKVQLKMSNHITCMHSPVDSIVIFSGFISPSDRDVSGLKYKLSVFLKKLFFNVLWTFMVFIGYNLVF